ncbi:hypothetical protein [Lysobacter gummosus]|uniref:hypothetical protein n=1 Tax=Lysobacter gummosus TaxID=262324 RepID=UPI00362A8179
MLVTTAGRSQCYRFVSRHCRCHWCGRRRTDTERSHDAFAVGESEFDQRQRPSLPSKDCAKTSGICVA